jgi:hypothetical protein
MLEHSGLLLKPWQDVTLTGPPAEKRGERSERRRPILDVETRQPVGAVRVRCLPQGWLCWFHRPVFEVVETEDDSLLCVLHGPVRNWFWPSSWELYDAEEMFVCGFRHTEVFDGTGRVRLRLVRLGADEFHFVGPDRRVLGKATITGTEVQVLFTEAVENDPYARMAILGTTIAVLERG